MHGALVEQEGGGGTLILGNQTNKNRKFSIFYFILKKPGAGQWQWDTDFCTFPRTLGNRPHPLHRILTNRST